MVTERVISRNANMDVDLETNLQNASVAISRVKENTDGFRNRNQFYKKGPEGNQGYVESLVGTERVKRQGNNEGPDGRPGIAGRDRPRNLADDGRNIEGSEIDRQRDLILARSLEKPVLTEQVERFRNSFRMLGETLDLTVSPNSELGKELIKERKLYRSTPEYKLAVEISDKYPLNNSYTPDYFKNRLKEVRRMESFFSAVPDSLDLIKEVNGIEVGAPEMCARTKATFYTYRSAISLIANVKLKEAIAFFRLEKNLVKTTFFNIYKKLIPNAIKILERYPPISKPHDHRIKALQKVQAGERVQNLFDLHKPERDFWRLRNNLARDKQINGMINMLDRLEQNWPTYIDDLWKHSDKLKPEQKTALALMINTGCRNVELVNGIKIERADRPWKDGVEREERIRLTVHSAKFKEVNTNDPNLKRYNKGQEFRTLLIVNNHPTINHLHSLVSQDKPLLFQIDNVKKLEFLKQYSQNLLIAHNKKMVRQGYPRLSALEMKQTFVTPYVFRHAFSARIKTELDKDETAISLGHVNPKMQVQYGSAKQRGGAGSGGKIIRVVGSRPTVKDNPKPGKRKDAFMSGILSQKGFKV